MGEVNPRALPFAAGLTAEAWGLPGRARLLSEGDLFEALPVVTAAAIRVFKSAPFGRESPAAFARRRANARSRNLLGGKCP